VTCRVRRLQARKHFLFVLRSRVSTLCYGNNGDARRWLIELSRRRVHLVATHLCLSLCLPAVCTCLCRHRASNSTENTSPLRHTMPNFCRCATTFRNAIAVTTCKRNHFSAHSTSLQETWCHSCSRKIFFIASSFLTYPTHSFSLVSYRLTHWLYTSMSWRLTEWV